MSIALKRVELANIRSHKAVVMEPSESGITSISGPNGSGKSTIVDSLAWALYGTKPAGVSKVVSIVREGATLGSDRIFVQLELEIDDRHMKIERRFVTKSGGVECEVWEAEEGENGETAWTTVAGPAVTHAEPYIRKLLRMDEKGFLAAILIQQKQVDQLISATPRERGAVIEKLTGISSVTAAVTESRQEYNNLRKMASFSTIDEQGLVDLKTSLLEHETDFAIRTSEFETLAREEKELKARGIELAREVEEASDRADAAQEAQARLSTIAGLLEAKEKELQRVLLEKNEKKKKLSSLSTGTSLIDVEAKVNSIQKEIKGLDEEAYGLKTTMLDLDATIARFKEMTERSSVKDADAARAGLLSTSSKRDAALVRLEDIRELMGTMRGQVSSLRSAANVLQEGEGHCPTCLQAVSEVTVAVDALMREAGDLENKISSSIEQEEKLSRGIANASDSIVKYEALIEAFTDLPEAENAKEKALLRLNDLEGERRTLEGERRAFEKIVRELQAEAELRNEYASLLKIAQSISDEQETLKAEEASLKAKNFNTLSPTALQRLRKTLEEARNKYMSTTSRLNEEKSEIRVLKERIQHLKEKISDQETQVAKHKELLKSVEVASNSTQLLEEFRSNRIESSVPLIESYASDLLSRFTEGKFTRLKLDGKFNASVVLADGAERAIGLLSGGELSAASMALRLAVAMMLNGGSAHSLIILDEVLVSQDQARAELILSTIKSVCKGQVVLIAHSDGINDISDKIVDLS